MSVTVIPYNVSVGLGGTTPDASGKLNILVGQGCTSSLSGLPAFATAVGNKTTYLWSISGTTFQTWSADTPAIPPVSGDENASYELDGPGPVNNPTAFWYWNDRHQSTETVTGRATVRPPAGQGAAFTVSVKQQVTVYLPKWTWYAVGGNMQVGTPNLLGSGTDYLLWTGPTAGSSEIGGMDWYATVSPPVGTTFGAGILELVQICTLNMSYTDRDFLGFTHTHTWSQNGEVGLDTVYPYGWTQGSPSYRSNDNPFIDLTSVNAIQATLGDQFEDFLMYFAPGSLQPVPLANFAWSTNGSASIPATNNWANFGTASAGAVTPSGLYNITGGEQLFPDVDADH